MKNGPSRSLRERVIDAAAVVLTREGAVGPLELLQQLRFLEPSHVQQWRKGNEPFRTLEPRIQCGAKKLHSTYEIFFEWVGQEQLEPFETSTGMIVAQYPGCATSEARRIAQHTAQRGSGRVGRSAAGRQLRPDAITLAVGAWIRHQHTTYDTLLMKGVARHDAREFIREQQQRVLDLWDG